MSSLGRQLKELPEGSAEYVRVKALYDNAHAAMLYAERTLTGGFTGEGIQEIS